MKHGFSLVELSIVLVILGLLTGGILAGQSLIRAAELRAITTEYDRYRTATQTFRDKYFAIPGDFNKAEDFWTQLAVANAACRDTASTTTATCNGDGDGNVEVINAPRSREAFRFWQHLANAALVEGNFNGINGGGGDYSAVLGTNTPRSRMGNGGWSVITRADATSGWYLQFFQPSNSVNWLMFGTAGSNGFTGVPIMKSEEAWNIDTKLDDGRPGTGNVTTFMNNYNAFCASTNIADTAAYRLDQSTTGCVLFMTL